MFRRSGARAGDGCGEACRPEQFRPDAAWMRVARRRCMGADVEGGHSEKGTVDSHLLGRGDRDEGIVDSHTRSEDIVDSHSPASALRRTSWTLTLLRGRCGQSLPSVPPASWTVTRLGPFAVRSSAWTVKSDRAWTSNSFRTSGFRLVCPPERVVGVDSQLRLSVDSQPRSGGTSWTVTHPGPGGIRLTCPAVAPPPRIRMWTANSTRRTPCERHGALANGHSAGRPPKGDRRPMPIRCLPATRV